MKLAKFLKLAKQDPLEDSDKDNYRDNPDWSRDQREHWGNDGSGCLIKCGNKILLLKRSPHVTEPNTWGIPGGAIPISKSTGKPKDAWESAKKETEEELGFLPPGFKNFEDKVVFNGKGFKYTTFIVKLPDGSVDHWHPILDWENSKAAWFTKNNLPSPLHFGIKWLLSNYNVWPKELKLGSVLNLRTKLLTTIGKFKVLEVDGNSIRNNLDVDFTNFGQHYRWKFIPNYEFWVDRESDPGELWFFIKHMLMEHHLMRKGLSYEEALDVADKAEQKERNLSNKNLAYKHNSDKTLGVKKILLKNINDLSVWLVDGELVRDWWNVDFTEGGHDLVYEFIPPNEIWIDDDLDLEEQDFVILHEITERNLMFKGCPYHKAHQVALKTEYQKRHRNLG